MAQDSSVPTPPKTGETRLSAEPGPFTWRAARNLTCCGPRCRIARYDRSVPDAATTSNCSCGVPVDFFWHSHRDIDGHIEAAVSALMTALLAPASRRPNPYWVADARRSFRRRLDRAARGELHPVDEVKGLGLEPRVPLFEIRWQVGVADEVDGRVRGNDVHMRLIHVEPPELGMSAVGLHAHEKEIVARDGLDVADLQNEQIRVALGVYQDGYASLWGVEARPGVRRQRS